MTHSFNSHFDIEGDYSGLWILERKNLKHNFNVSMHPSVIPFLRHFVTLQCFVLFQRHGGAYISLTIYVIKAIQMMLILAERNICMRSGEDMVITL